MRALVRSSDVSSGDSNVRRGGGSGGDSFVWDS